MQQQPPPEEKATRVWIEEIKPQIDCGRYPIKRTVGETVEVSASIFADGHDLLQAVLQYKYDNGDWQEVAMEYQGKDLWTASFPVDTVGTYHYTVRAWIDYFASWQRDLRTKFQAGQDVAGELLEGAAMIAATAGWALSPDDDWLTTMASTLRALKPMENMVAKATAPDITAMMRRYPERSRQSVYAQSLQVTVEPPMAGFSSWYEIFPRSLTRTRKRAALSRMSSCCCRKSPAWVLTSSTCRPSTLSV